MRGGGHETQPSVGRLREFAGGRRASGNNSNGQKTEGDGKAQQRALGVASRNDHCHDQDSTAGYETGDTESPPGHALGDHPPPTPDGEGEAKDSEDHVEGIVDEEAGDSDGKDAPVAAEDDCHRSSSDGILCVGFVIEHFPSCQPRPRFRVSRLGSEGLRVDFF